MVHTALLDFLGFLLIFALAPTSNGEPDDPFPGDVLTPYKEHYRTKRNHRYVRDCQPIHFGNTTFDLANASRGQKPGEHFVQIHNIYHEYQQAGTQKNVVGHVVTIEDPLRTFSVLEPEEIGGCSKFTRTTVAQSARQRKCHVAANAGFFRTRDGKCYGNVFSDGRKVVDSGGVQNANFGIRKSGAIVTGYLSEQDVLQVDDPFIQLVSGVVWIIRNGTMYVNESKKAECRETEETGSMDLFASVMSARTALGHDAQGRVVIVQIDGKTHHRGIDLYNFGKLLLKFGVVNAINLDGGGSATMVVNDTVVNYPSDGCDNFICPRKVSTIVCAHEPDCEPRDCNGHGLCEMGMCVCDSQWIGESCDVLMCKHNNCSSNGLCSIQDGCLCFPGWKGTNCSEACLPGFYGLNCSHVCDCRNGATCDPKDGLCHCTAGWTEKSCQQRCLPGSFGQNCSKVCNCSGSCGCTVETGQCTEDDTMAVPNGTRRWLQCMVGSKVRSLSQRMTVNQLSSKKVKDVEKEYSELFVWFVAVISLCAISLLANLLLVYLACNQATQRGLRTRKVQQDALLFSPDEDDDDEL